MPCYGLLNLEIITTELLDDLGLEGQMELNSDEWGGNWWLRAVVMNLMFQQRIALFGIEMRCVGYRIYFVRILAFSRKKHHFHDFIAFFSHFFRFLQREFHVVGGTLCVEFQVNLVEKFR